MPRARSFTSFNRDSSDLEPQRLCPKGTQSYNRADGDDVLAAILLAKGRGFLVCGGCGFLGTGSPPGSVLISQDVSHTPAQASANSDCCRDAPGSVINPDGHRVALPPLAQIENVQQVFLMALSRRWRLSLVCKGHRVLRALNALCCRFFAQFRTINRSARRLKCTDAGKKTVRDLA
jgi:hypothetical protein